MSLRERFADKLLLNEPLAKYTAARLGGAADMVYIARESEQELAEVVSTAWEEHIPVRVLGGGANVLVSDQGVRGLVVINSVDDVEFREDRLVRAASGVGLTTLARRCASRGLSGFEWAVSVPGTVGGAVVNNAGARGGDMTGCVREIAIIEANQAEETSGDKKRVPTTDGETDAKHGVPTIMRLVDLAYGYRTSSLKQREDKRFLVLSATFQFKSDEPEGIQARMDANIAHRKRTQPPGASLGSIFKNPPGDYAGRLIEAAGLKGYAIGGAQVSPVHANFFINTGGASASDYYALIQHVRDVVYQQSSVRLEMEVETVGEGFSLVG